MTANPATVRFFDIVKVEIREKKKNKKVRKGS